MLLVCLLSALLAFDWQAGDTLSVAATTAKTEAFVPVPVPQSVLARMRGRSLPQSGEAIDVSQLRYIPMLHYTLDGYVLTGEMVVHGSIAADVADVFARLYKARYPIERIRLVDDYNADDETSMRANNTSAFCHRTVAGSKRLSRHAQGHAVDLNPLYNPCLQIVRNARGDSVGYRKLQPSTAVRYVDRSRSFPYKLQASDLAVRLFKQRGFKWGGDWKHSKDYQHFEK